MRGGKKHNFRQFVSILRNESFSCCFSRRELFVSLAGVDWLVSRWTALHCNSLSQVLYDDTNRAIKFAAESAGDADPHLLMSDSNLRADPKSFILFGKCKTLKSPHRWRTTHKSARKAAACTSRTALVVLRQHKKGQRWYEHPVAVSSARHRLDPIKMIVAWLFLCQLPYNDSLSLLRLI